MGALLAPGIRRAWLPPAEAQKVSAPCPGLQAYNEIQTIKPRAEGRNPGAWLGRGLRGEARRGAAGGL